MQFITNILTDMVKSCNTASVTEYDARYSPLMHATFKQQAMYYFMLYTTQLICNLYFSGISV